LTATEIRSSRPAVDRRTQRTRAALIDAFRDLVLTEGYEAVTPTRLAAAANVGRSTFYEHFASVDEVLGVSMGRLFGPLVASTLSPRVTPDMIEVIQHFWDNRKIGKAMLAGGARPVVQSILTERFETGLAGLRADLGAATPAASARLAAVHLAAGTLAILETWLAGRAPGTAVQIAEALHAAGYASARALTGDPIGNPSTSS
jgi:AcrR family transcriptional regulator